MINDEWRRGWESGYKIGLMEGYSDGRYAATQRVIEINMKNR